MHTISYKDVPDYAKRALSVLDEAGYEAWIVGGWVRDTILSQKTHDVDIATNALWPKTKELFEKSGYKVFETGIAHGTLTVFIDSYPLEITTFRAEGTYSDMRHPDHVEFVDDINQDLCRRDFTINAMAYSPKHGLLDLFSGYEDLENKVIRCVGDPETRFSEDALRMLRAIRFSARMGFDIEEATYNALIKNCDNLKNVADERIGQEIDGILKSGHMGSIMRKYPYILTVCIPEFYPTIGFDQHSKYHRYDIYEHTSYVLDGVEVWSAQNSTQELRWAALFHDIGKSECFSVDDEGEGHFYKHPMISAKIARSTLSRFAINSSTTNKIIALIEEHDIALTPTRKSILSMLKRLERKCPTDAISLSFQALVLRKADAYGKNAFCLNYANEIDKMEQILREIIRERTPYSVKDLAISGKDVMDIVGIEPSRKVGEILDLCLDEVIAGRVSPDYESQKSFLKSISL